MGNNTMKVKIGKINGSDVYEDPNCPPDMMYFVNEKNHLVFTVDNRSRWQRFKDWLKEIVRKYRV